MIRNNNDIVGTNKDKKLSSSGTPTGPDKSTPPNPREITLPQNKQHPQNSNPQQKYPPETNPSEGQEPK